MQLSECFGDKSHRSVEIIARSGVGNQTDGIPVVRSGRRRNQCVVSFDQPETDRVMVRPIQRFVRDVSNSSKSSGLSRRIEGAECRQRVVRAAAVGGLGGGARARGGSDSESGGLPRRIGVTSQPCFLSSTKLSSGK